MSTYTSEQAAGIDWARRWEKYDIPLRYRGLGVADMQRTPANSRALDMTANLVETWPARRPVGGDTLSQDRSLIGKGVIAIGAYGTGKTRLVCAAATDVARRYNTAVRYIPVAKYFTSIKDSPDTAPYLKRTVMTVPLLVWDDQGTEYDSGSGWVGSEIYRILRDRFDHARPTLITTNLALAEWSKKYQGSMFSFLHEAFDAAVITGEDWRRAKR